MVSNFFRLLTYRYLELVPYFNRLRFELNRWRFHAAGKKGSLAASVRIHGRCAISIGDRVAFRENVLIAGNGSLYVGSGTAINEYTMIGCTEMISIGDNCMLAPYCYVLDVDHEFASTSIPIRDQGYRHSPVKIGNDVWLGTGVVVTKGVTIGDGCIVAANSVVTKDIPPFSIAGGVPAKVLRSRK